MELNRTSTMTSLGLLILRIGVGCLMLTHGIGKLRMLLAGEFDQFGDPIGLGSTSSLVMVTVAEFLGAALVVLGLGTRVAALLVVIAMGVAAFVVHAADPWTMEQAFREFAAGETEFPLSKEPALLYLVPFLALVCTGAGEISLDRMVQKRMATAGRRTP